MRDLVVPLPEVVSVSVFVYEITQNKIKAP